MKHRHTLFLLATAVVMAACGHNSLPEGVMDAERMADYLTEAYTLEAYNVVENKSNPNSLTPEVKAAYDDILRRQHLTVDEVEASLAYYGKHPDKYHPILDEVSKRLAKERD